MTSHRLDQLNQRNRILRLFAAGLTPNEIGRLESMRAESVRAVLRRHSTITPSEVKRALREQR